MSLESYPEYKDSGVEWLGKVPEHWSIDKISRISKSAVGWTPPTGNSEFYGGNNKWANISDLGPRTINDTTKRISDSAVSFSRLKVSPAGSLLFSFKLSVGQVSFAGVDLYTNEAIATFFETASVCLKYAYYAYPLFIVENAGENIYGAKILNQERIGNAKIALPTREEQLAIADYLDRETAEIDAFIADQEELIALLNERRTATITQAVATGLDPDAPMKNSPWGFVPSHWSAMKLAWGFFFLNGDRGSAYPSRDEFVLDGVPFINAGHLRDGRIDYSEMNFVTSEKYDSMGGAKLRPRDILYCLRGSLGKNALALDLNDGALASSLVAIRNRDEGVVRTEYMFRLLNSYLEETQRAKLPNGSAQPNMSVDDLRAFSFPLPPVGEQDAILSYLDSEIEEIDAAISDARESIALSKERRAAVISAAVTGKIDVRGVLAPATKMMEAESVGVA